MCGTEVSQAHCKNDGCGVSSRMPVTAGIGTAVGGACGRALRRMHALVLIACVGWAPSVALAVCAPADAALAGRYAATGTQATASLRLDADGSFQIRDVPVAGVEASGCWQHSENTVVLMERALDGGDGIARTLPAPLTEADLSAVRGDGIETLQQAVDAGLLPLARWWANQPRNAGDSVRVKVYEPRYGLAVGDARALLRLADGRVIEQAPESGGDGEFEFSGLPVDAAVTAVGVRFPQQPDRPRWLSVDDATKRLYLIAFDANAIGAAEGGMMTLTVQTDRSLISDFPDATQFKPVP